MADMTHQATTDSPRHRRLTYQVLLASLWITLVMLVIKLWLGWRTQSLAILAESLHTLLDSLSTLLSFLALSNDDRLGWHQVWSHGKREIMGVLAVVAFLGFSSFSLLLMAAQSLETLGDQELTVAGPSLQLLGLITIITFALALFKRYRGQTTEFALLRLNAQHTLRDSWLTLLVFLGLIGVRLGYGWLDPLMTVLLVLTLVGSSWQLINWQLPFMVQQVAIAPEVLAQMAKQVEGVSHCYKVRSRGLVGRRVFIEMHLGVHPEFMGIARIIAQRIEAMIRTRYGPVKVDIFIDPETEPDTPMLPDHSIRRFYSQNDPDLN
ncbi:MAG: cation diffusion facilitator family transporter [Leptolyngbyaceae cyanobacterium]